MAPRINLIQMRKLVSILYKGLHICSYLSSNKKTKEQLFSSHINDTNRYTKNFPLLEENYGSPEFGDALDHPKIFSTIIDATTDIEKLLTDNKWITPREYPSNNCTNMAPVSKNDFTTEHQEYTLAHQFVHAKRKYQSGSCYSCSRDRNSSSIKESIIIMDSSLFNETGCSLNMLLEEEAPYFQLKIKNGVNQNRYEVGSVAMNYQMGAIIEPMIKNIFKNKKISKEIIATFEYSSERNNSVNSSVVLVISEDENNNSLGVLSEIAKRGYLPLIETSSADSVDMKTRFKTLRTFLEIHDLIGSTCNPLNFTEIEQVMNPEINLEININPVIWPLQYIGTRLESIQRLNDEISQDKKQSQVKNILFKVDKDDFETNRFDFSIDPIRFWM